MEGQREGEREEKVKWGVEKRREQKRAFSAKRWAEPDTKSSASPQPLTPRGI